MIRGRIRRSLACAALCLAVSSPWTAVGSATPSEAANPLDDARLARADREPENWLMHGRTYDEQRYSPLAQVTTANVDRLGLAWFFDVPTTRGMEATPIVVDGVMYVSGSWSIVYALDAATGRLLWSHDPKVDRAWLQYACCDAVNRGVAAYRELVFIGTLDGYLVAIDRNSGEERWRVDTVARQPGYTITGAPRVVNGMVLIGNGGAEYGVRGFVTAYDALSGAERWRFYTVPGKPSETSPPLERRIAATWTGEWWRLGGGGTVWDSIAFDPDLGLVYVGVGNGSPWNQALRSPDGGDNLFLASIVALRANDGSYVWHYQTTPGETWDYTATQQMILADVAIGGRPRRVLMQAPKNGFFYVLDRATGELVSARNYVPVSWASHVDLASGRPVERPGARYGAAGTAVVEPSGGGGHNWHPMSFSPRTRLVYLSTQRAPDVFRADAEFEAAPGFWNTGVDLAAQLPPEALAALDGDRDRYRPYTSALQAWDPVTQREAWRVNLPFLSRSGVLSTAGDLVFHGSVTGEFTAHDARDGRHLWSFPAQTGVIAGPISYRVGGTQFVAVAAGSGGAAGLVGGTDDAKLRPGNRSRVLAFSLDGRGVLPEIQLAETPLPPLQARMSAAQEKRGHRIYHQRCAVCHGWNAISGGLVPDLRRLSPSAHEVWDLIVRDGVKKAVGMPAFGTVLPKEDTDAVRAYVIGRAHESAAGLGSDESVPRTQ
jgi:alcohol dehydrogenase (cytochrome c)/quinohemoprotein ethanol dehydrogenase